MTVFGSGSHPRAAPGLPERGAGTAGDPDLAPGMGWTPGATGVAAAFGRSLLSVVLPRSCVGCGAWDRAVCRDCRGIWAQPPRRCEEDTVHLAAQEYGRARLGLPVWALAPYRGAARRMILGWKSGRRPDGAAVLVPAVQHAAGLIAGQLGPAGPVVVVPAPSGLRRRVARRFVAGALAAGVARGLAGSGIEVVEVADVLRTRGASIHSLGARARSGARAIRLRRGSLVPDQALLVDDVVTTGATAAAARDVLQSQGAQVLGVVVLAATPSPRSSRWRADSSGVGLS